MRLGAVVSGVILVTCATMSCRCTREPPTPQPTLSPQEAHAVAAAEAFVLGNGYVDQPADPAVVQWDIMEGANPAAGITPEVILERRRNTIIGQAYGLSRGRRRSRSGWTIYFEYNPEFLKRLFGVESEPSKATGRAVEVSEDFKELEMAHTDIFLETAEVVLRAPMKGAHGLKR